MANLFNPTGGETTTSKQKNLYMGLVNLQPIMFNPTKEDMIRIQGLSESAAEKLRDENFNYIQVLPSMQGSNKTKLSLLCSFDPNDYIKSQDGSKLPIEYVTIDIFISPDTETASTGSIKVMNDSVNDTWVSMENANGKSAVEMLLDNQKMQWFVKDNNGNPYNLREACIGEATLYKLLVTIYGKVGTRNNPIKNFVLGEDPKQTMEDLWNGEFEMLNTLLENKAFIDPKTKKPYRITALLTVKGSNSVNPNTGLPYFNQEVYTNTDSFAKANRSLSKRAMENIQEGRVKGFIPELPELKFTIFNASEIFQNTEVKDSQPSGKVDITTEEDDDLPF